MKLTMRLGPRSYDIILRRGALGRVGQLVNLSRKVLVVTDSGVPQQYLSTVLAQCPQGVPVVLEQGEGSKSLAVTERLCAAMLQHGFARTDAVRWATPRALPPHAICAASILSTAPPPRLRR